MRLLKLAFISITLIITSISCTDNNSVTKTDTGELLVATSSVSISGPDRLEAGETGTWTINTLQGISPDSYTWYHKPTGGTWSEVGTGFFHSQGTGNGETDYQLKVEVADTESKRTLDSHPVIVGSAVDHPDFD